MWFKLNFNIYWVNEIKIKNGMNVCPAKICKTLIFVVVWVRIIDFLFHCSDSHGNLMCVNRGIVYRRSHVFEGCGQSRVKSWQHTSLGGIDGYVVSCWHKSNLRWSTWGIVCRFTKRKTAFLCFWKDSYRRRLISKKFLDILLTSWNLQTF